MRRRDRIALALVFVGAVTVARPALAQEGSAAARSFQTGSQAYARGEFRAAAAAFDQAYGIAPRGAAAYNGGLAWEAAGELVRAADDYARALRTADLGTAERADATGRLKALESRVGRLSVFAPDDAQITVDGAEVTDRARGLHVTPGAHAIRVHYENGHVESRSVRVGAGELMEVRLEPHDSPAAAPEPTPSPAPSPSPEPRAHASGEPTETSTQKWLAYVALGGAVVASGVAIATYESGVSALDEYNSGHDTSASLRSQAESMRTATWVSWGFAGALAATGVVLYLTAPSSSSASTPSAALELLPAGIRLRVGF
jgi:tetratricopeptide (TPR) repeat protein